MSFFFQTLPLHPAPLPQESLTSYLIRLAEANEIDSVNGFSTVTEVWLAHQSRQPDAPLADYQSLAETTAQSEARLRDLTFYHLMDKFGRGAPGQRVGPFLRGPLPSICAIVRSALRSRVITSCSGAF